MNQEARFMATDTITAPEPLAPAIPPAACGSSAANVLFSNQNFCHFFSTAVKL